MTEQNNTEFDFNFPVGPGQITGVTELRETPNGGSQQRMVGQPTRIQQPSSIKGRRWFFCRGYAGGFGAEYGVTLDRRTVEARCKKKAGAGKLVNIKGAWHWLANEKAGR